MAVEKTGYNLGALMVELQRLVEESMTKKQEFHGREITTKNTESEDCSKFINLLTKALNTGKAVLSDNKDLIDRIKLYRSDIITAKDDLVWDTEEKIKSQIKIVQDHVQIVMQKINLSFTKLSQLFKDATEFAHISSDLVNEHKAQIKQMQLK